MGLVFFTSVIMLLLSTMLTACAYSVQSQVQPSTKLAGAKREVQASKLHALPRKLRLSEMEATVVGQEGQDSAPEHKNVNVLAAGTNKPLIHKEEEGEGVEVMNRSSSGTWQEWTEGEDEDTSAFFTMDYSKVRRRRPIHNKSLKPKEITVAAAATP